MDSKGKLILLLVVGVILAVGVIMMRNRSSDEPVAEPSESNRVIVARRDLPAGTQVQIGQDIDWQELAPEEIKEDFLREGKARIENYNGAITRRLLRQGDPVTQNSLSKAGEGGFMSAVLEPGLRAVSLSVTAASGNAGFISPGDRVDLIVTHRIRARDNSGNDSVVSETFVRDVRVLAVDQMLDNPDNKAILAKTVTVEVNPQQAEQIAVASEMGKISMALRSLANAPRNPPTPGSDAAHMITDLYGNYTRDSDISQFLGADPVNPRIKVIHGDQVETIDVY